MLKTTLFVLILTGLLMTGCAKPTPAEICSPEWIQPRVDKAMHAFDKNTRKSLRTLQKAGDTVKAGNAIGPLRMLSVLISLQSTLDQFVDGQALKDIRTIAKTCNDPELVTRSFRSFLKKKGVPGIVTDLLEDLQQFSTL